MFPSIESSSFIQVPLRLIPTDHISRLTNHSASSSTSPGIYNCFYFTFHSPRPHRTVVPRPRVRIRCRQRRPCGRGSGRRTKKGWIHPSAVARNCNGPALISHPSARLRPSPRDRQTAAAARWQHCNGFDLEQPATVRPCAVCA